MENHYCSCKLMRRWGAHRLGAYSCTPYGKPLLQL